MGNAAGQSSGPGVTDAGEYRRPGQVAAVAAGQDLSRLLVGEQEGREQGGGRSGGGQQGSGPGLFVDVHGSGGRAGGRVSAAHAGEAGDEVVFRADEDMGRFCVLFRPLLPQPHKLGEGTVAPVAGDGQKAVRPYGLFQLSGLDFRTAVGVQNGVACGLEVAVQGDQVLHLAAHGDGGNVFCRDLAGKLQGDGTEGIPPTAGSCS